MPSTDSTDIKHVDCGVIIALKEEYRDKPSFQGFETAFRTRDAITRGGRTYFQFDFLCMNGSPRSGVATVLYEMGPSIAADVTREMVTFFDPILMVNIGIAGAISSHLRLGDIVVAEMCEDYEIAGAVVDDGANGFIQEFDGTPYQSYGPHFHSVQQFDLAKSSQHDDWHRFAAACLRDGIDAAALEALRRQKLIGDAPGIEGGSLACGNKVVKSKRFAKELKQHRRKFLAVDMESAGFLRACAEFGERPRLVLKTITDFADHRKEYLDDLGTDAIRAWAMASAYDLLARLLRHTLPLVRLSNLQPDAALSNMGGSELKTRLTSLCRKRFLKGRYQQMSVRSRSDVEDFDVLFRHILSQPAIPPTVGVFEYLESIIMSSRSPYPVRIEGEPGTGKTTLLNLLYLWLLGAYERDATRPFPIYINLRSYQRPPAYRSRAEADNSLRADLDDLRTLVDSGEQVVVLLDGVDEYVKVDDPFENTVLDLLDATIYPCKRVIGVGLNYMPNEERFRRPLPRADDPEDVWICSGVPLTHTSIEEFFASMQQVMTGNRSERVRSTILTCVREKLRLASLDLITLSMLIKFVPRRRGNINSLASLYGAFCDDFLNQHERDASLLGAAALAYRYAIKQDLQRHDELLPKRDWRLLHSHRLVKDYLVAVHVVHSFRELGKGKDAAIGDLSCVYPQEINQFAKELFNSETGIQNEVLRGVEEAYFKGDLATKTHACYMAGRVSRGSNIAARRRAITFLLQCRRNFEAKERECDEIDRHELLLGRTIYISLAYLCEGDASDAYLMRLMSNERSDDLNRGFHLEYYGDIPFDAQDPKSMAHEDPMGDPQNISPCHHTFERLSQRITLKINEANYGLRDIEIYTLCSLAQHRHAVGVLSEEIREKLNAILPVLMDAEVARPLRPYIGMIYEHFKKPRFYRAHIVEQLYTLKKEPRRGWVGEIGSEERVESVADHTLLAVYLARIYLPAQDRGEPEYDKGRIIDMLLYHDIGEFRAGDVGSSLKTSTDDDIEEAAVQYLGACGTYLQVSNLSSIVSVQHEFERADDINKKVAKDIDCLEYYVQLNQYRPTLAQQFVAMKEKQVESNLRTSHGRQMFEILREPYRVRRP